MDFCWYYVDLSPDHDREHILPDGTFELIVNLQETPRKLFHGDSNDSDAYGGESLLIWDEQGKTISYDYFTTDGFMTTGTLEAKDGKFITHEDVKGDANGVTEVRSTSEIPSGRQISCQSRVFEERSVEKRPRAKSFSNKASPP